MTSFISHGAHQPIGIFDSGIGGLTVAHTIAKLLPNENLIYLGDTAHVPWGDKSVAAIQSYCIKICDMLLAHHCKAIVIACNTASAVAYNLLLDHIGERAHVINVIDPVVHYLVTNHPHQKIGLIGTKQTVRSRAHHDRIELLRKDITLTALPTPLLVPLIEEGFADKAVTMMILEEYLNHPLLKNIQALILGCTHYPVIKSHIEHYYKNQLDIIDSSEFAALALKAVLEKNALLNPNPCQKKVFYVSDYSEFFENMARIFFPENIHLEPYTLWE